MNMQKGMDLTEHISHQNMQACMKNMAIGFNISLGNMLAMSY